MTVYIIENVNEHNETVHTIELFSYESKDWYIFDKVAEYYDKLFDEAKITEFFKTSNYYTITAKNSKIYAFYAHSYYELVNRLRILGISDIELHSPEGYDEIYTNMMNKYFNKILYS